MPDFTSETLYKFTSQNKDVISDLDQINHKLNEQGSGVSRLGSQLKTLAVTYLTVTTASKSLDLARLGEQVDNTRIRFNSFFKDLDSGNNALRRAQEVTGGTVDNLKLMQDVIKGFDVGRSFDDILTILEFARFRARDTGEEFSALFDQINRALVQGSEAGGGVSLRRFLGIEAQGKEAAEIIALLDSRNRQLRQSTSDVSEAMAQFDANVANISQTAGNYLRYVLTPWIEKISQLINLQTNVNRTDELILAQISALEKLGATARGKELAEGIKNLTGNAAKFGLTIKNLDIDIKKFQEALDDEGLLAIEKQGLSEYIDLLIKYRDELKSLSGEIGPVYNQMFGPPAPEPQSALAKMLIAVAGAATTTEALEIQLAYLRETLKGLNKESDEYAQTVLKISELENQRAQIAQDTGEKQKTRFRNELARAREELKIKIGLGLAANQELEALLQQQIDSNNDLYYRDFEAWAALMQERINLMRQQQAEQDKIDAEQKRLDDENNRHYQQLLDERVAFLQQTFGTAFMDAFSDILDGSTKRFEDYLADLGKLILKFLASRALTSFFFALASGPLAGLFGGGSAGGLVGGGFKGGGGILSAPPTNLIPSGGSILRAAAGAQRFNPTFNPSFTTSVNPTPVYVQLLITDEGLAARVEQGNKQRDRTKYF